MQAVLWTILVVSGADPVDMTSVPSAVVGTSYAAPCEGCYGSDCDGGGYYSHGVGDCLFDCCGPMPQTCYAPRYGCYPGNNRHMHRYPAFHGYYYRKPYNYRHLFEYPWHAAPHQPSAYFTYESDVVPAGATDAMPLDSQGQPTPAPKAPAKPVPEKQARLHRHTIR